MHVGLFSVVSLTQASASQRKLRLLLDCFATDDNFRVAPQIIDRISQTAASRTCIGDNVVGRVGEAQH
jgi:hypothetical protein